MINTSEKWDNMTIDDKLQLIAIHTSYENVFINHFNFYTKICMEKFNDLPNIQYGRLKEIISIALIS